MKKMLIVCSCSALAGTLLAVVPDVSFYTPTTVRIVRAPTGSVPKPVPVVVAKPGKVKVAVSEDAAAKTWRSAGLCVRLDKKTESVSFLKTDGTVLLA